jgi:AraC-like DNA-binding protein
MSRSAAKSLGRTTSFEENAWHNAREGWRKLYGDFETKGVSVEMHDFQSAEPSDWGRSFRPRSVEVCLNISGRGDVSAARNRMSLRPNSAGYYAIGNERMEATRNAAEQHRFATFEFSSEFLARQLAGSEDELDPILRKSVLSSRSRSAVGDLRAFTPSQRKLVADLGNPPVGPTALPIWFQSKVLEVMSECFFQRDQAELFCTRQKRLAGERIERVVAILRLRLIDPPSLEELGREVGVSQFYLSRIFSEEMRITIPQFLRRIRMERAAELLRDGRHNVTDAAFAVGYSSLGHFSKSFCEEIGCCPGLYPHAKNLAGR